jgi:hypothetical protein
MTSGFGDPLDARHIRLADATFDECDEQVSDGLAGRRERQVR